MKRANEMAEEVRWYLEHVKEDDARYVAGELEKEGYDVELDGDDSGSGFSGLWIVKAERGAE